MIIAIYGRRTQDDFAPQLSAFLQTLARLGIDVVMHRKLYVSLVHLMPASLAAVRKVTNVPDFRADAAISIGGDGTFLRTAMWVGPKKIPIIGVNTGHLGYLSSASVDELGDLLNELISGNYAISERTLVEVVSPELATWPYALNEAAVSKEETASIIEADTRINGEPLVCYKADGLIVATPTGSTAYNLSVGGPIIQPSAPVWVISPIAAHSLGQRPLVVSDSSEIEITVQGRARGFRLSLDGRSVTLPIGATVRMRRAPFPIRLITRPGHTFPAALRQKLHWSE